MELLMACVVEWFIVFCKGTIATIAMTALLFVMLICYAGLSKFFRYIEKD